MAVVYGKAMLYIEREYHENPKEFRFIVQPSILTATGGDYALDCAHEDFGLMCTDTLPAPSAAYKLSPGERIRVYVVYEFRYSQDYWGEWDVTLDYRKERVMWRGKPVKFYERDNRGIS